MAERKRILVLTLSFGSGHVRAAEAVASEMTALDREANVRLTDALAGSRLLFRAAYVAPYWLMLRRAPALWRWLFARRNKSRKPETAPEWALRRGCPQVFDEIARWRPHVVVACEVAACEMAAAAKRHGLTDAKLLCVITDHEAEPAWVKSEADAYCVADERVGESLIAWGARREIVRVCGIPFGREFTPERDGTVQLAQARARFHLRGGVPLVLLMGGGMGPTRMDAVADQLCRAETPLDVVAVAGHDRRALRRLERVRDVHAARGSSSVALQAHGWVDEIAPLMRAASLLVTKPGGLSTAEAAACALPCVLFDAIPGPEETNARRVVEAGAGVETRGAKETADAVLALVADESRRLRMSERAAHLSQPEAAVIVARLALDYARGDMASCAAQSQQKDLQLQPDDLRRRTA
jgi:processive 1,2-diacylglycerol beta-glucosyltransferase